MTKLAAITSLDCVAGKISCSFHERFTSIYVHDARTRKIKVMYTFHMAF